VAIMSYMTQRQNVITLNVRSHFAPKKTFRLTQTIEARAFSSGQAILTFPEGGTKVILCVNDGNPLCIYLLK